MAFRHCREGICNHKLKVTRKKRKKPAKSKSKRK